MTIEMDASRTGSKIYPFSLAFWRRANAADIDPHLVYYGPLPQTDRFVYEIVTSLPTPAYVYVIQDIEGTVIYVGKTVNPVGRFSKHRSLKDWWPSEGMLTLLGIEARDRREADSLSLELESMAIRDLRPKRNIAGVVR